MPFITVDTHAHLCDKVFCNDLEKVVLKAQQSGVQAIILVGENLEDGKRNLELSDQYPCLKPAAGLYPEYADDKEELNRYAEKPPLLRIIFSAGV